MNKRYLVLVGLTIGVMVLGITGLACGAPYNIVDLGTLGGYSTEATDINNSGQVVGNSGDRAFLYSNGVMTIIGGAGSYACAINDSGQVAGWNAVGYDNGFLYSGGTWNYSYIQELFGDDINDNGQVVGSDIRAQSAFLYSNGVIIPLGMPYSGFLSINESGQIVGSLRPDGTAYDRAILYENGIWTDLNDLIDPMSGWTLWHANAINDYGQIVGGGVTSDGQQRAFLLNPTGEPLPIPVKSVPEPSTLFLLVSAVAVLTGTGIRRKRS